MQTLEQTLRSQRSKPTKKRHIWHWGKFSFAFQRADDYWAEYHETVDKMIFGLRLVVKDNDQMWQFFWFKTLFVIAIVEPYAKDKN